MAQNPTKLELEYARIRGARKALRAIIRTLEGADCYRPGGRLYSAFYVLIDALLFAEKSNVWAQFHTSQPELFQTNEPSSLDDGSSSGGSDG